MLKQMFFLATLIAFVLPAAQAQKLFTRSGKVYFNATAPSSPEVIEASHNSGTFVLDQSTGNLEMAVLVKGFSFERALMQEHFNENYLESSKFPKAIFKGKLDKLSDVNFTKDGTYTANVTGEMTIHGVTQKVNTPVSFTVKGGVVNATTKFVLTLTDYGIDIPSLVADKVGKQANLSVSVDLKPM
ncbi:MAG: YceI family protein [Saprospiraceae bacterium]